MLTIVAFLSILLRDVFH